MWKANAVQSAIRRGSKLVATIGPASTNPQVLRNLIREGVDVVRLNFSHGSQGEHLARLKAVRSEAATVGRPVAILQDLCGPKMRTAPLANPQQPIELKEGDILELLGRKDVPGDATAKRTGTTYEPLARDVVPGTNILLSDGNIGVQVERVVGESVFARVVDGGILKGSQGLNIPNCKLSVDSVTAKDIADARFGWENGVDFVAVSFVRSAKDMMTVREVLEQARAESGKRDPKQLLRPLPHLIAKLERPESLDNLEAILAVSDGVMVARGDLGVEMAPESVPIAQKRIVVEANRRGVPVIVATQMLESMIENARPTRAEVSDVSNAIFDGADACMLSGETAVGAHPVDAVKMMAKIAQNIHVHADVDESILDQQRSHGRGQSPAELDGQVDNADVQESIGAAATAIANRVNAAAIVTLTRSGKSARMMARFRPKAPIIALADTEEVCRQLNLVRDVFPLNAIRHTTVTDATTFANDVLLNLGIGRKGDHVVLIGVHPLSAKNEPTNVIKVMRIK